MRIAPLAATAARAADQEKFSKLSAGSVYLSLSLETRLSFLGSANFQLVAVVCGLITDAGREIARAHHANRPPFCSLWLFYPSAAAQRSSQKDIAASSAASAATPSSAIASGEIIGSPSFTAAVVGNHTRLQYRYVRPSDPFLSSTSFTTLKRLTLPPTRN